jgi:hypothetical protein
LTKRESENGGTRRALEEGPAEGQDAGSSPKEPRREKKELSRLKALQIKYDEVKKREGELDRQNKWLHSHIAALNTEIQDKNIKMDSQASYLQDIEMNISPLGQKLSPRDQAYVYSHGRPMIGILMSCLAQLEKLENEKDHDMRQHRKEIKSLNESHAHQLRTTQESYQLELVQKESHHVEEIRILKEDHQRERGRLQAEINRLEDGLLTTVDHFQPMPDQKLRAIFTSLKKLIGQVARCPLENDPRRLGEMFNRSAFIDVAAENHRMFLIQSIFWEILVDGLFSTPFRVFGFSGDQFYKSWQDLFGKRALFLFSSG